MLSLSESKIPSLSDEEAKALRDLKIEMKKAFFVREVILFGSKARGDYNKDSDVDVLFLVEEEANVNNRSKLWDAQWEINFKYDTNISGILRNYDKFNRGEGEYPMFVKTIMEEGIRIEL